jgi:hypothetical protein
VATFTVSSSGTTCGLSTQAAHTFAQGDLLTVVPPGTQDATLADGGLTLCFTR